MSVGSKIRYVRELRNMSLTELHQKTGLSLSYLSDAENNRCQMSLKSLSKVANALSVDISYILDESASTLEQLAKIKNFELPEDVKEYVTKSESLPYIVLAKKAQEEGLSTEFLSKLIEIYKKEIDSSK
jgi:Helix-turn-helix.